MDEDQVGYSYFKTEVAHPFILGAAVFSIFWGIVNVFLIRKIDMTNSLPIAKALDDAKGTDEEQALMGEEDSDDDMPKTPEGILERMNFIGEKITDGSNSFLAEEYLYLAIFSAVFSIILGLTVDWQEMHADENPTNFPYTAVAYIIGCSTSILAGYIGMAIAVYSNTRTTYMCCISTDAGFQTAFRGGQVLGFVLVGLALLVLELILITYKMFWFDVALEGMGASIKKHQICELVRRLFELVAGYGLGASSVALFGRVGGGIYTKAADVGADLVGKTLKDLKEDDPSNPGTIADNVGDNVGDIAGMGADLFGSLAESTAAALVVSSTSFDLIVETDALYFPLMITAVGIIASFFSVIIAYCFTVTETNVQTTLKLQLVFSTIIMTILLVPVMWILPEYFSLQYHPNVSRWIAYGCVICGLYSGMIIGFSTEYYTSNEYGPTQYLIKQTENGPAPNIIQGLALGYLSCIIPILCLTATIGYSFQTTGMYGIGLAALGMLGSLPVALAIDGYGPIADNAGGIAEMSGLPSQIRDKTDALDAAGNTTAAIGKGFAIGSAALVGLALFGAFITRIGADGVDILKPVQICGNLIGAMLPYAFSALTMKAVGDAAFEMMDFIKADFKRGEEIKERNKGKPREEQEKYEPDYDGCIKISTDASLRYMILPGVIVIFTPLVAGFLFGPNAVAGLLPGIIVSGIQVAISASNTGGAWDNAKKGVEKERSAFRAEAKRAGINPKTVEAEFRALAADDPRYAELKDWAERAESIKERHMAAVVGDTVGDPLKDTSGPAINILIKLSAITSLVFGSYIKNYHVHWTSDSD